MKKSFEVVASVPFKEQIEPKSIQEIGREIVRLLDEIASNLETLLEHAGGDPGYGLPDSLPGVHQDILRLQDLQRQSIQAQVLSAFEEAEILTVHGPSRN